VGHSIFGLLGILLLPISLLIILYAGLYIEMGRSRQARVFGIGGFLILGAAFALMALGPLLSALVFPTIGVSSPWRESVLSFVGAIIFLAVAGIGLFFLVFYELAPRNIFFTFVEEGSAKAVVRAGKFVRALMEWRGYTFNEEWDVIPGESPRILGGLRFFGLWPLEQIYVYRFQWIGVKPDGTTDTHKERELDYIFVKEDVYFREVPNAEDKNKLPITIKLILPIRVINPYRALFRIQNWLEAVLNRIVDKVRESIGRMTYESIISDRQQAIKVIRDTIAPILEEYRNEYGVSVRQVEFLEFEPPEAFRTATIQAYLAERDKEKIIILAEAEKRRLDKVGRGEALRIGHVYRKIRDYKDIGLIIRGFEALEKGNTNWVATAGLKDIFQTIFGKPLEQVMPEEARKARQVGDLGAPQLDE